MKHHIKITPINNVKDSAVVDCSLIQTRIFDRETEITMFNTVNKQQRKGVFMNFSLFDDLLVEGYTKYVVLHVLSK